MASASKALSDVSTSVEGVSRGPQGIHRNFRSIKEPKDAEVVINTAESKPEEAAEKIDLEREGFVGAVRESA
jgi:hypothetical protein